MSILPVVAREMNVLSRRRSTYLARTLTVALALFLMVWIFLVAVAGLSVAQLGRAVFIGLASLSFAYALLAGIHATSDAISEEKRDGTLGLLFLTDLKPYDITLGKLAATSLSAFYALVGLVPTLALAILLGGVALSDVLRMSLVLLNTMFLSLSIGMLVSAMSINERRAIFASCVALAILTAGPVIITLTILGFEALPAIGIWTSPIYPFLCVFKQTGSIPGFDENLFYPSLILQHALAWFCLLRATHLLPRYVVGVPMTWRDRLAQRFDQYAYGSPLERAQLRRRLLDRNAFLWLAARERVKPLWAWLVIAIFFALYLWVAWGFNGILFDLHTSATLIFLVHIVLKLWVASEVCSRMIQDRRSGALELLLSSPLTVRDIALGQHLALKRIFGKPLLALLLTEVLLMFLALRFMPKPPPLDRALLYLAAITTLLLDLWALKWLGMWLSLFAKSIERVLIGIVARVMVAPWLFFLGFEAATAALLSFHGYPPEFRPILVRWWFFSVLFSVAFGVFARRNFLRKCRAAVSEPHETPGALAKATLVAREQPQGTRVIPGIMLRRPILSATTLILFVLLAGLFARRFYWSARLETKLQSIRALNEPAKILELSKAYPPIPRNQNAFTTLADAGPLNRFAATGWDWRFLNHPASNHLHGLDPTNRHVLSAIMGNNAAQMAALRQLDQFTNAYIEPINDFRYARVTDLFGYAHLAVIDLLLALDAKDSGRAGEALERALRYAALLRRQASTYSQIVALNLALKTRRALEPAFFQGVLQEPSLARGQALAQAIDSPNVPRKMLLVARALALDPPVEMQSASQLRGDGLAGARRSLKRAIGTEQAQVVRVLDLYQEALAICSTAHSEQYRWASALSSVTSFGPERAISLDQLHESEIRQVFLSEVRMTTEIRLLETAFAIERYLRAHGDYPQNLQALVPEFLASPPIDPFTGELLLWTDFSGGKILASVGGGSESEPAPAPDLAFHFWAREEKQP